MSDIKSDYAYHIQNLVDYEPDCQVVELHVALMLEKKVAELRAVISEANDYLNFNNLTTIGHGSGLHESFKHILLITK